MLATELEAGEVKLTNTLDVERKSQDMAVSEKLVADLYEEFSSHFKKIEWVGKNNYKYIVFHNGVIIQSGNLVSNGTITYPLSYTQKPIVLYFPGKENNFGCYITEETENGFRYNEYWGSGSFKTLETPTWLSIGV